MDVEVQFQFYTDYFFAEDIWGNGFVPDQTEWLYLKSQKYYPYYTEGEEWTESHFYVNYNNIEGAYEKQYANNGRVGFSCDFLIRSSITDFTEYFGTPYFSEDKIYFGIPEIAVAEAYVYDTQINHDLHTEYANYFIGEDQIPEFSGLSAIRESCDEAWDTDLQDRLGSLGLITQSVGDVREVPIEPYKIAPSTNYNLPRIDQTTFKVHEVNTPEITIWTQSFSVNYATVEIDSKGANSGLLDIPTGIQTKNEIRTVAFQVKNQEIQQTAKIRYYIWGTAELTPDTRDVLLNSPEFVQGDTFWDLTFWGDTGASVIFTESGIARAWNNFWSGKIGKTLKWILIIGLIVAVPLGTVFLLNKMGIIQGIQNRKLVESVMKGIGTPKASTTL